MNRIILLIPVLLLAGCTFSRQLSSEKARELLFTDLEGGAAGSVVKPVGAHLDVQQIEDGVSAEASGTIQAQVLQNTFSELGTLELPDHRTITEIQPLLKSGDEKEINVSAQFVRNNTGWVLNGAEYSLRVGDLGKPMASFDSAVDMSTAEGKKMAVLLDRYKDEIAAVQAVDETLGKYADFKNDFIDHVSYWGGMGDHIQALFPDEPNLKERIDQTIGRTGYAGDEERRRIFEPIWQRHMSAAQATKAEAEKKLQDTTAQLSNVSLK